MQGIGFRADKILNKRTEYFNTDHRNSYKQNSYKSMKKTREFRWTDLKTSSRSNISINRLLKDQRKELKTY